jgi:endonuclease YncB( thermonuclease family)
MSKAIGLVFAAVLLGFMTLAGAGPRPGGGPALPRLSRPAEEPSCRDAGERAGLVGRGEGGLVGTGDHAGLVGTGDRTGRVGGGEPAGRVGSGEPARPVGSPDYAGLVGAGELAGPAGRGEHAGLGVTGEYAGMAGHALGVVRLAGRAPPGCDHPCQAGIRACRTATATVVRVVDGDTVILRISGRRERVRLIGVDAPETWLRHDCFGVEATRALRRLAPPGSAVRAAPDVELRDHYGRLLLYLWTRDGTFVNATMVRTGYARTLLIPPNLSRATTLREAQRTAHHTHTGLWRACQSTRPPPPASVGRGRLPRLFPVGLGRLRSVGSAGPSWSARPVPVG